MFTKFIGHGEQLKKDKIMKLEKILDLKKLNDWYEGSTDCSSCPFVNICDSLQEFPNCLVEKFLGIGEDEEE